MPDNIADIAQRHGFSPEAARIVAEALRHGGGRMAQFSHPELGGMGQWAAGGMVMIGDMFNNALKARVDALCRDLAAAPGPVPAASGPMDVAPSAESAASGPMDVAPSAKSAASGPVDVAPSAKSAASGPVDVAPSAKSAASGSGAQPPPAGDWWPEGLEQASATGAQNNMRYACFPNQSRLAILRDGRVSVYDTGHHRISGFSQQQSGSQTLTFTSQDGPVRIEDLKEM